MSDVLEREETAETGEELAPVVSGQVVGRTKNLTKNEEARLFELFTRTRVAQEFCLLEAFEGKAHKAVRMDSFEDYCRERLGLDYSATRLSQIVTAARVNRALVGGYVPITANTDTSELPAIEGKLEIPEAIALQLSRLPEDHWAKVYAEYQGFSKSAKKDGKTQAEVKEELKRIVNRTLKELSPDAVPVKRGPKPKSQANGAEPPATIAPERLSRMEPVVGAIYDGSEEQQRIESEQEARANGSYLEEVGAAGAGAGEAYPPGYTERLEERLNIANSFITEFCDWLDNDAGNEARLMQMRNDVEVYRGKYGV